MQDSLVVAESQPYPTVDTPLPDAARRWCELGFEVLLLNRVDPATGVCTCGKGPACDTPGKHPARSGWSNGKNKKPNPHTRISDPDLAERTFREAPHLNLGLAMGGPNRVVTLDVDGPTGHASLAALETSHGPLPATLTQSTGRENGGEHRLFRVPDELDIAAIRNSISLVGPGLDVRAQGGQIVGAPSDHRSGRRYTVTVAAPPADLPRWLYDLMAPSKPPTRSPHPDDPPADPEHLAWVLDKAAAKVQLADRGTFHDTVNKAGYTLGGLAHAGMDEATARDAILEAARTAGMNLAQAGEKFTRAFADGRAAPLSTTRDDAPAPTVSRDDEHFHDQVKLYCQQTSETAKRITKALTAAFSGTPLDARVPPDKAVAAVESVNQDATTESLAAFLARSPTFDIPAVTRTIEEIRTARERAARPVSDFSEASCVDRFVRDHGEALRYCHELGCWYRWDAAVGLWVRDGLAAEARAKRTGASLAQLALEQLEKPASVVERLQRGRTWESIARHARSPLGVSLETFDRDPWLLTCVNGTIDLRTGILRPHDPKDLVTRGSSTPYLSTATHPLFDAFLENVQPDPDVRAYLQRLIGYALVGEVTEHVFPIFVGGGSDGKSVFLGVLGQVIGTHAHTIQAKTLLVSRNEEHPTVLAQFKGRRLVIANELRESAVLDSALVKQLTGGDEINARYMYGNPFTFQPTHTLILAGNGLPRVPEVDNGTWRRIVVVPWGASIAEEDQIKTLKRELMGEAPGILRWCVEGCLEWQRIGLAPPQILRDRTLEYRHGSDPVRRFLAECCEISPEATVTAVALYRKYIEWCTESGERYPMAKNIFGERIRRYYGIQAGRKDEQRIYTGVMLQDGLAMGLRQYN